jgi:endoglucanase
LLIDSFETGDKVNALGGPWFGYTDGFSTSTGLELVPGHDSTYAGHMGFTLSAGATAIYVGVGTTTRPDSASTGIDASAYQGIRFWVRGSGSYACQAATSKTATEYNHWSATVIPTAEWQHIELPFSQFTAAPWGTPQPWDPTTLYAFQWTASGAAGSAAEIFLDDIELYTAAESIGPPKAVVYATPKVNQVGYLPSARKIFVIVAAGDTATAKVGDTFTVNDATTGAVKMTGTLAGPTVDDTASSGEVVLQGDFSTLVAPGHYVVKVGAQTSPPFEVGDHVYDALLRASLRAFNLIRCGVAVDDAETGVKHAACHQQDAVLRSDPSTSLDLTGGWHNAGDFGKWAHMEALSTSKMMWAFELNPDGVRGLNTGTADSSNQVPDLLDEARWGLEWLLMLQQADGSVIHKVDTEPNFAWGLAPENDPNTRYASYASTLDTADAAAAWSQASRVFRPFDAAFADRCLDAAKRAFAWIEANPSVVGSDPYYNDSDPSQEIAWALGEMSRTLNDASLRTRFAAVVDAGPVSAVSWMNPQLLGYMAVAKDASADEALKNAVITRITALADNLSTTVQSTGYRVATAAAEYWWESNESLLDRADALAFASLLSDKDEYRQLALEQLDWILGKNPLDQCYVTGFGTRPVVHPYHWISYALGKVMPGWVSGGPNRYPDGVDAPLKSLQAAGTPPAKCYLDLASGAGSYASNEGETSANAGLVLLTGLMAKAPASTGGGGGCGCSLGTDARATSGAVFGGLALSLAALLARTRRKRANVPDRRFPGRGVGPETPIQ